MHFLVDSGSCVVYSSMSKKPGLFSDSTVLVFTMVTGMHLTLSLQQAGAVSKKIFYCFFLVYWVHLNDIYQKLGGWFTRSLETIMFYFISYMIQPYLKRAKIGCIDFPLIIIRLEMHDNGSP